MTSHTDDDLTTLISRGDWAGGVDLPAIGEVTRLARRRRTRNRAAVVGGAVAACAVIGGSATLALPHHGGTPQPPVASSPGPVSGAHQPKPCMTAQTYLSTNQAAPGRVSFRLGNIWATPCTMPVPEAVDLHRGMAIVPVDLTGQPATVVVPGRQQAVFDISTTSGPDCDELKLHFDRAGWTYGMNLTSGVGCGPDPVVTGVHIEPLDPDVP
jgi:hypothetical protein